MADTNTETTALVDPRRFLLEMFDAAVASVSAAHCLPSHLGPRPVGQVVVVGAGKAAAAMAAVVEQQWGGPLRGLVVTRYGHGVTCSQIEVVEAAHPVPDQAGQAAARRILDSVQGLNENDLVLCLISGGGSALLSLPAPGIALEDKRRVNQALLRCGATIGEINCVRKHLSAIKGGRLALAAAPARIITVLISDVPGDDPSVIASGPTLPDASTRLDALAVIEKYRIDLPQALREHLASDECETPKPGDPRFAMHRVHVAATAQDALNAAAEFARSRGIMAHILSDCMEGESKDVALVHAAIARQIARAEQPFRRPCLLLSGGETTVTVRGTGRGGRNAEFLLAFAQALDGAKDASGIYALACDTDGIDGSEDNAGAIYAPDSLKRATALGLSARRMLDNNDAYGFFAQLGDLIMTGPTRTNVNDFRAILIL